MDDFADAIDNTSTNAPAGRDLLLVDDEGLLLDDARSGRATMRNRLWGRVEATMTSAATTKKDYATAILLNLVVPGAGFMYVGRVAFGVGVLLFYGLCVAAVLAVPPSLTAVVANFAGGIAVVAAIDGYLVVRKHNTAVEAATTRACPWCAEKIQRTAVVCRFCNREVPA